MKKIILMSILCLGLCVSTVSANTSGTEIVMEGLVQKTSTSVITSTGSSHLTSAVNKGNYEYIGARTVIINIADTGWKTGLSSVSSGTVSSLLKEPVHEHKVVGGWYN